MLQSLYTKQNAWQPLLNLLPALKKANILDKETLDTLTISTELALLAETKDLNHHWKQLNRHLKKHPKIIVGYITSLMKHRDFKQAKICIEAQLKREWSDTLCEYYADIETDETEKQFKLAEKWLKQQPENAAILATLGTLAHRLQLWGNAKTYYHHSLTIKPNIKTYLCLGKLLEQLGESAEVIEQYRKALNHISQIENQ